MFPLTGVQRGKNAFSLGSRKEAEFAFLLLLSGARVLVEQEQDYCDSRTAPESRHAGPHIGFIMSIRPIISLLLILAMKASAARIGGPSSHLVRPPPRIFAADPRAVMDPSIEPFVERLALEAVRGVFNSFMAWMSLRMLLSRRNGLGELLGSLGNRTASGAALDQPVVNCSTTFDDVAGIDEVVEELQEAVAYLRDPERFSRLGARMPRGVLLEGIPGTGKTMLARACAGEAGVPFFSASASGFDEKYVGVGAQRVRALFAAARRAAPAIVFIDEIDCIGASRERGGERQVHAQTLNALLVEMDGFAQNAGLVVLAATNQVGSLDSALRRPGRFDRIIHVPPPDIGGRRRLLSRLAGRLPLADDVSLEELAASTSGMTGAELDNMLNQAACIYTACAPHVHRMGAAWALHGRRMYTARQHARSGGAARGDHRCLAGDADPSPDSNTNPAPDPDPDPGPGPGPSPRHSRGLHRRWPWPRSRRRATRCSSAWRGTRRW